MKTVILSLDTKRFLLVLICLILIFASLDGATTKCQSWKFSQI